MTRVARFCAFLCGLHAVQLCAATPVITPETYHRSEARTYLAFPQWSAVHGAGEYANYIQAGRPASDYPYWGYVAQQWSGYAQAVKATLRQEAEPLAHARIVTSTSIDTLGMAIRSTYEVTLGRLAELTRASGETSEERLAAKVAQGYAHFVRTRPWHEFDFAGALKALWHDTGSGGPDIVRKWERKYALTSEYATKAVLAWFGGKLAGFGASLGASVGGSATATQPRTAVVVDRWVDRIAGNWPEMERLRSFPRGGELVLLPRHDAFKTVAIAIARSGANFAEVAGNGADKRILISVIVPRDWRPDSEGSQSLFEQPVLTFPEQKRVALTVPIRDLAQTLRELDGMQITIEQVYDY